MTDRKIEWATSAELIDYPVAVDFMERRASQIADGSRSELIWLVEHPAVYTGGTSAKPHDLLNAGAFPVYQTGRGGQFTYHGPGQRVVYVMLDVKQRFGDVRAFVTALEHWIIETLREIGIAAHVHSGRVGVWVERADKGRNREDKIAAIGIRMRKWVSFHGLSINVAPNLSHYDGIVPCGISDQGVTSLADLGNPISMGALDAILNGTFETAFAQTTNVADPLS